MSKTYNDKQFVNSFIKRVEKAKQIKHDIKKGELTESRSQATAKLKRRVKVIFKTLPSAKNRARELQKKDLLHYNVSASMDLFSEAYLKELFKGFL